MAKERNEVPAARKWRTEDIFATEEEWEALYASVAARLDFSAFAGKLGEAENLLACFKKQNEVMGDLSKLDVYAFMKHDEDTRRTEYTALSSRVETLAVKYSENTAFVLPELTALPVAALRAFAADPRFSDYDYTLRSVIREKPHVLSRKTERLLASGGKMFGGYHEVFSMLDNADFKPPVIRVGGRKIELTHGTYGVCLHDPDRRVRRAAFKAYYKHYGEQLNTIAAVYAGSVEKDVFLARARHYEDSLAAALFRTDVAPVVYRNLIESVHGALPLLHRYYEVRRKISGLPRLHMYDIYTSPVENAEIRVDYEEAFGIVKKGLAPLGARYAELLDEAHDNGWIDVEETAGKRSGAYSISVYGLPHPYVLLNYQKETNEVFTIAHELGHAMHSYFSERNQPQEKADYRIFVAEVASTVNEVLLIRHLLSETEDPKLKKYLLSYYLDTLKGTLFRQTQFAEFEVLAHGMAERGEPLTSEALSAAYLDLNKKYYGKAVYSDAEIACEWARIPHFYRAFYVYQYATGIISAVAIAERILNEGEPAVADYFRFLSSGGSDSPVNLLKLAGVDLTKKTAFEACMRSFEAALREFEALD